MNIRMVYALLAMFFLQASFVLANSMNKDVLTAAFVRNLSHFAEVHKLTYKQANDLLFDYVEKDYGISKGGVAPVDKNITIFLKDKHNSAQISEIRWEGKPSDSVEVLITDGKTVFRDESNVDLNSLCIIVFTPKEVVFTDYRSKITGAYHRNLGKIVK